jgi:hypothetical protein
MAILVAAVAVWLGAVAAGFLWLLDYSMTPGVRGPTPAVWPADSAIERASGTPTLVMFAHPLCPCSRASLSELGELLRKAGPMAAHVLMLAPHDAGSDWKDPGLREAAAAIPHVRVAADDDGVEARRFGATTSGHVVIYGRDGRLLFSGGITAARGHLGDNLGLQRALAALGAGAPTCVESPVFGCSLKDCR